MYLGRTDTVVFISTRAPHKFLSDSVEISFRTRLPRPSMASGATQQSNIHAWGGWGSGDSPMIIQRSMSSATTPPAPQCCVQALLVLLCRLSCHVPSRCPSVHCADRGHRTGEFWFTARIRVCVCGRVSVSARVRARVCASYVRRRACACACACCTRA